MSALNTGKLYNYFKALNPMKCIRDNFSPDGLKSKSSKIKKAMKQ